MPALDMSQLIPGSNFGGAQNSFPTASSTSTPAIGGGTNPFLPGFPSGTNTPPIDSTINQAGGGNDLNSIISKLMGGGGGINFPANMGGASGSSLAGFNPADAFGLGKGDPNAAHNFVKAMHKAGFSSGVAGQLWNFLQSGAGFNPQIAQALINFMQPQVARGEADIMERFGAMGLGMSSPAAIGLGDYLSQVNLNEEAIFAQMAEQATQNYMNVLMGGKGPAPKGFFDNFIAWLSAAGSAASGSGAILQGL